MVKNNFPSAHSTTILEPTLVPQSTLVNGEKIVTYFEKKVDISKDLPPIDSFPTLEELLQANVQLKEYHITVGRDLEETMSNNEEYAVSLYGDAEEAIASQTSSENVVTETETN